MGTESSASRRRAPLSIAYFFLREPLRRMAFALANLRSPYQRYRHAQGLHGLRVALAMLAVLLLSRVLNLPHGLWAPVSMMTVMGGIQHHVNIRKKAGERGLGTLLGAMAGLFIILLNDYVGSPALVYGLEALIAGICAFYAIGRGGYTALLTAITMAIVAGQSDAIDVGLWRTLNVCVGIVVALAFSFVLPLHASYTWRYSLALNLRRLSNLIRRLQSDDTVPMETRNLVFADLSKRAIELRELMPSVAKEMQVPVRQLEDIQHHHRAISASMELIASARLNATEADQHALSLTFRGREACAMRAALIMMARALRVGNMTALNVDALPMEQGRLETREHGQVEPGMPSRLARGTTMVACMAAGMPDSAADAATPADVAVVSRPGADEAATEKAASAMPRPASLQGADWAIRQAAQQIDQLRRALIALPRLPM